MKRRTFLMCLSLAIVIIAITPLLAADPPAKAPEAEEALSEAQQSLLLQLSDAEANIRALNLALVRTGYKVGIAYNRIDNGQRGNEQLDRKGGGPVGWQDFYGKTARSFYIPDSEATLHSQGMTGRTDIHVTQGNHPIQRPKQFDYIYKANNDQVARAKEQVAALAQDQATLLARRQKHEADQSRLWAMLAFERITDREIADEPLCRFKLKSSTSASDPRVQVLRAVVLFLRTADKVAADTLESVKTDQAAAFGDLDPRMKGAYATLRASLADAMITSDLAPEDKKKTDALKTLCKQLWDESSIVADNYRNALDRDQAKEDNSKLVFRGKLQESLAKFSGMTAELDVQVSDVAKSWGIGVEKGVESMDRVPASTHNIAARLPSEAHKPATGNPATLEEALLNYKWAWTHAPLPPDELTFHKDGTATCTRFSWHWEITGPRTVIAKDATQVQNGVTHHQPNFRATLTFDDTFNTLEAWKQARRMEGIITADGALSPK
ncbi:MAG TPA: hypothetical protein VIM11_06610 [Tepidisphaeraceae bacterium]|jgi:hypothetical protein